MSSNQTPIRNAALMLYGRGITLDQLQKCAERTESADLISQQNKSKLRNPRKTEKMPPYC